MAQSYARYDRGRLVTKASTTDEGFLVADAIVTRTGVFTYMNNDGSLRFELRHPDDVMQADSLNSMKMLPITNGHPEERMVTPTNAKELSVGFTGAMVKTDGPFIVNSLKITDQKTIDDITSGLRQELSLGYMVDVIQEDGEYLGERYTHKQKNIKYNHLAVVDMARAGPQARIHLDEGDALEKESQFNDYKFKEREMSDVEKMTNVTLDSGLVYKAAPEVANAYTKLDSKVNALEAKLAEVSAAAEKLKAEKDILKEKVDAADKIDLNKLVNDGVKARVALVESVKTIMGDKFAAMKLDGLTDSEIKKEVVKQQCTAVNVDEKSEPYIQARFDTLYEDADKKAIASQREVSADTKTDSKPAIDCKSAREKMIERAINGSAKPAVTAAN